MTYHKGVKHDQEAGGNTHKTKDNGRNGNGIGNISLLTTKDMCEWIEETKGKPKPRQLFGELWYEGDTCFLIGDTDAGKSTLAVQIANSISKGKAVGWFKAPPKQTVIYADFEDSEEMLYMKYSENGTEYNFTEGFFRATLNVDTLPPDNLQGAILEALEKLVIEKRAKVLMIDNITYISYVNEKASDATKFMHALEAIKKRHGLSILIVGHTPKRDKREPITQDNMMGSKNLVNFIKSMFALATSSKSEDSRYLKQLKGKHGPKVYGFDNVIDCKLEKIGTFLGLTMIGNDSEFYHLKKSGKAEQRDGAIYEASMEDKSTYQQLATKFDVSEATVKRAVKKGKEGQFSDV